jgi:hypothetical protein
MLRHLKFRGSTEIPGSGDVPIDYLTRRRASWLIDV